MHQSYNLGTYSPNHLQEHPKSIFLQDFVNLNVTQLLIGLKILLSHSELVLLSNATKYRKIRKTRLRMFFTLKAPFTKIVVFAASVDQDQVSN